MSEELKRLHTKCKERYDSAIHYAKICSMSYADSNSPEYRAEYLKYKYKAEAWAEVIILIERELNS